MFTIGVTALRDAIMCFDARVLDLMSRGELVFASSGESETRAAVEAIRGCKTADRNDIELVTVNYGGLFVAVAYNETLVSVYDDLAVEEDLVGLYGENV